MNIFSETDKQNGVELETKTIMEEHNLLTTETRVVEDTKKDEEVKVIERQQRAKCKYISPDGKKCRRLSEEGSLYCRECADKVPKPEPKFNIMTMDTCTKTMLSLHMSVYMMAEQASQFTSYPMSGLVDELREDSKELKEIYENLVEFYGQDTVARFLNPMVSLSLISLKHGVCAMEKGKKSSSSNEQRS